MYKNFTIYLLCITIVFSLFTPSLSLASDTVSGKVILESISNPQAHPRLLIKPEDISVISSGILADEFKQTALKKLKSRCKTYSTRTQDYVIEGNRIFSDCIEARLELFELCTAYLITNDTSYAEWAWEELLVACSDGYAADVWNLTNKNGSRLDSGKLFTGVAFAYDTLYNYLSDERKEYIRTQVEHYIDYYNNRSNPFADTVKYADSNWAAVIGSAMLMTGLAFAGDDPELDSKLELFVERAFKMIGDISSKIPSDGQWKEGRGYHEYIQEHLAWAMASLKNSCGTDFGLMHGKGKNLKKMPEYAMRTCTANGTFNFASTTGNSSDTQLLIQFCPEAMLIARLYDDNNALALYNNFYKSAGVAEKYGSRYLLFAPSDTDYGIEFPKLDSICTESGYSSILSSWTDNESLKLGIQGGLTAKYGSKQYDKGSFILENMGERWFIELGKRNSSFIDDWIKTAKLHNVLTVKSDGDSMGQEFEKAAYPYLYDSSKSESYVIYDLTEAYTNRLNSYKRGFFVDRDENILTLRDELNLGSAKELKWNFFTRANIELTDNNTKAVLTINGKKMYIVADCSIPGWQFGTDTALNLAKEIAPTYYESYKNAIDKFFNGINVLTICAEGSGNINMGIKFIPEGAEASASPDLSVPLDSWRVHNEETPYVSEFQFKHDDLTKENELFIEAESFSDEGNIIQIIIAHYSGTELKHISTIPTDTIPACGKTSFKKTIPHYNDSDIIKAFAFDSIGNLIPLNRSGILQ